MYTLSLLDITGTNVLATLFDARILNHSRGISRPGRMTFTLPVGSPNASTSRLKKFQHVRLARRKQDGSEDDEYAWYGYIESHKREQPELYTVYCAGKLQYFAHRFTTKNQSVAGQGSTEAFRLLTNTNGDNDTGIVSGTGGVTAYQNITTSGRKDLLSTWGDIANATGGEFEITPYRIFNFVPMLGTDKTGTSLVLRYRTDQKGSTVEAVSEGEDGATIRNRVIGTNANGTLESIQENAASIAKYGLLEEVKVFPEAQDQATLDALTQAYLLQVREATPDFGTRPIMAEQRFTISGTRAIVGFQFGDLVPGDLVTCDIVSESQTVQATKRIIEVMVDVDENLKEIVTYTLGEAGVRISVSSIGGGAAKVVDMRLLRLEQGSASGGGGGGATASYVDREVPTGSINGSNATFTLASTPVAGSDHVWLNGVLQNAGGSDYTITGTSIVFVAAPLAGNALVVSYRTSNGTTTFSDKEVPAGAINDSNVTFTLAHTPVAGAEYVYLNGVLQAGSGSDYSISAGTITLVNAPSSGATLLVSYRY